jgi:hypothetical protein
MLVAATLAGLSARPSDAAAPAERRHQLQLGVWFANSYGSQEPFINLAASRSSGWAFSMPGRQGFVEGEEAEAAGLSDPLTGEFTAKASKADSAASNGGILVDAPQFPKFYAEEWTLDWKGDGYGYVHGWDRATEINRTRTSVTYRLRPANVAAGAIRFSQIRTAVTDIRLYRTRFKADLDKGRIWSPIFVEEAKKYDVIRTMDLQGMNNSPVRRFDQIATMSDLWGQRYAFQWPEIRRYGMPYEALFKLGEESGADLWVHIPPQIGAKTPVGMPSLRDERYPNVPNGDKVRAATAKDARAILESAEWDRFADAFVERYFASNYPKDRPLYIEIGNEIWNYASGFFVSTHYAHGIAEGMGLEGGPGAGYGLLTARWMIAIDAALAKRKAKANFVFVFATHTGNPWRTEMAFEAFSGFMKAKGRDPKAQTRRLALALTSYYGYFQPMSEAVVGVADGPAAAAAWEREIRKDPTALAARFSKVVLDGPANMVNTKAWVLARWREHKKISDRYGARLLGAYEGGSHLDVYGDVKNSAAFRKWWTDYHWGPAGAAVSREFHKALLAEFPDVILSNYVGLGGALDASAPWNDGHYGAPTELGRSWEELADPARL